ncbi:MAG: hypothetical protein K0S34_2121 [Bacillales bacterium]|jgi:HAD superfamily hydrolase (TIGR01549 family)|nr:hypothetical protein [Bacillales bacterium]
MESQIKDYDIFIFDCDGVLMDVNLLKCEAFGKAVEGYPTETVEDFVSHCKKTFGVSRYVKFKEFLSDFAKEQFQETKFNILLDKYATLCRELYSSANITPGCESLLTKLSNCNKKLYVASGSDENELIEVFKGRNLDKYFNGIYGSPKTKSECTSIILNNNPDKRAIFIGDALSDLKTAQEHGIDFIYMSKFTVQTKDQDEKCRSGAVKVINVLEDIL